jgi:peptide deformylase
MAIKKISEIGSEVIRSKATELSLITPSKLKKLIGDLTDTMRSEGLVGIAAPQIGIGMRVFLTEVRKTKSRKNIKELDPLRVFINPEIISSSKKEIDGYEGCGSIAHGGLFGVVKRPEKVCVQAFNEHGEAFELETGGLLARIIQHEVDHLNGICFIDHVKNTKKLLGRDEYVKYKKSLSGSKRKQ